MSDSVKELEQAYEFVGILMSDPTFVKDMNECEKAYEFAEMYDREQEEWRAKYRPRTRRRIVEDIVTVVSDNMVENKAEQEELADDESVNEPPPTLPPFTQVPFTPSQTMDTFVDMA